MAVRTRSRVLAVTLSWSFITRETVLGDTPARSATSWIVAITRRTQNKWSRRARSCRPSPPRVQAIAQPDNDVMHVDIKCLQWTSSRTFEDMKGHFGTCESDE